MAGAGVAHPVATTAGAPLIFRPTGDPAAYIPDALGLPAPPPTAAALLPDLILALARAERRLMDDPELSHPYYWAAFTMVGARGRE